MSFNLDDFKKKLQTRAWALNTKTVVPILYFVELLNFKDVQSFLEKNDISPEILQEGLEKEIERNIGIYKEQNEYMCFGNLSGGLTFQRNENDDEDMSTEEFIESLQYNSNVEEAIAHIALSLKLKSESLTALSVFQSLFDKHWAIVMPNAFITAKLIDVDNRLNPSIDFGEHLDNTEITSNVEILLRRAFNDANVVKALQNALKDSFLQKGDMDQDSHRSGSVAGSAPSDNIQP